MHSAILMATQNPVMHPNAKIKGGMKSSAAAASIISTYCNSILTQPDINTDILPDLPAHQKSARTHATNWQNNLQPLVIKTNADIIDFANDFECYYDPLVKLAKEIANDHENAQAIADFKQGLVLLKNTVQNKETEAKTVITHLESFSNDLAEDARNFSADFNKAESELAGKDGEIAALKKQVDAIHDAMQKDLAMIAGGSVGVVIGGLMVAVGVLAELETAGASTGLVIAGLAVAGAGTGVTIAGGIDYGKETNKLAETLKELKTIQQQYAATKNINHVVQSFSTQAKAAHTAVSSLVSGWQVLQKDFNEFDAALDRVDPNTGFFLQAQLNSAYKDWTDVAQQAQHLQKFFSPKVVKGIIGTDGKVHPQFQAA